MRSFIKVLALSLAIAVAAVMFTSCGDSNTPGSSDTSAQASSTAKPTEAAVAGKTETWGNITVFVPDDMELSGGTLLNKEDKNKLTLSAKAGMAYYNIGIVTAEQAEANVDVTKSVNSAFNPEDINFSVGATEWKGVAYVSGGIDCAQIYGTVNKNVVELIFAVNKYDSDKTKAILASLIIASVETTETAETSEPAESTEPEDTTEPEESMESSDTDVKQTVGIEGPGADGRYTYDKVSFEIPDGMQQLGYGTAMLISEDYPTHSDSVTFTYITEDRSLFTEENLKSEFEQAFEYKNFTYDNGTKDGTDYVLITFDAEKAEVEFSYTIYYYFIGDHAVCVTFTETSGDYTGAFKAMADDIMIVK